MKLKNFFRGFVRYFQVATLFLFLVGQAQASSSDFFMVTIENLTETQPFTPPVVVTHRQPLSLFTIGDKANFELKEIAENGNLAPMINLLAADAHVADFVVAESVDQPPLLPGEKVSVEISADMGAKYLSIAAMLICSNDGFTGVDSLRLPKKVGESVEMYTNAYDAGTEINTEDFADIVPPCPALSGVPSTDMGSGVSDPALFEDGIIMHHPGIDGTLPDSDLSPENHGWENPVAKITVKKMSGKIIRLGLIGDGSGEGSSGTVKVKNSPYGPDEFKLKVQGLPPHERITVFLTEAQGPGGLPAQFIGEFTTNDEGKGKLELKAEIVNAFAAANQVQEDSDGIAPPGMSPPAGLLRSAGGNANTIPLNWIRGYFVPEPGFTVFGPSESIAGGPIAFFSDSPLP